MSSTALRRTIAWSVSVVLVTALVSGLTAVPASADPLVVCAGEQEATYSPALTFLYQSVNVVIIESYDCVGSVSEGFAIEDVSQQTVSCLLPNPPFVPPNIIDYHWNNHRDSEITFTATTVEHAGGQTIVTSFGKVTHGHLKGHPAQRVVALVDLDLLQCLAGDVHSQSGPAVLTIE